MLSYVLKHCGAKLFLGPQCAEAALTKDFTALDPHRFKCEIRCVGF